MKYPQIIQGGMGIGISNWQLAREVSRQGGLGVVSGTALASVFVRRLQDGDLGGHLRRALERFPAPEIAAEVLATYFLPNGRAPGIPYKRNPMYTLPPPLSLDRLTVVANFVEVFLAKEGHSGVVGINLLEKVQIPNPASLYGAMLAGADYVLMGAGIPREIPGLLDSFADHKPGTLRIRVEGAGPNDDHNLIFDPRLTIPLESPMPLLRPRFLAVISSATLAANLAKKANGRVDGFVVENKTAGGHNAPPRGPLQISTNGEPIYGPKDEADIAAIRELGRPFWLAGSFGHPQKLNEALALGAEGIQAGTIFALSKESGFGHVFKNALVESAGIGKDIRIFTDPHASPSGFPFKVADLENTLANPRVYESRNRICDLGYLRMPYVKANGTLGYRCPSEPQTAYVHKGGKIEDTVNRKCLCNGLMSAAGMPQIQRGGTIEPALITAGDDIDSVKQISDGGSYSAADVMNYLRGL